MSKKLKIFIDAEVLVATHFSGIGHYTLEMLRALDKQIDSRPDVEIVLGVYFRRINIAKQYGFRNFKFRRSPFPLRISNVLKIKNLQPFYDLFFGKYVYFFPNYTTWPLLFSKSVSVVYDLSFEYHPEYVEPGNQRFLSNSVKLTTKRSNRIVTISKNSQKEITSFYGIKSEKVPIIYPGVDQSTFFQWPVEEVSRIKARYGIHGKYILYVGNIEPRKNLKNLLLAYEGLSQKTRNEYSLVLIGARGWLDGEIFEIIERLRMAGNIIQQPTSYVKDKDRAALYSGASLFVYPSKYEGFGIPPIEAMACGVPTITSNNSSLPEAAGDAAIYVDADSVKMLQKEMYKVLNYNNQSLNAMARKGFVQVDKFSWQHEARKLLEVFEEVKNGK
jgi:glycosyltransferase involved in cell wall biosynthesis